MNERLKNIINISVGLIGFILISYLLPNSQISSEAAYALATMALMIYWWITKPVHIAVVALLPIVIVSIFDIVPIGTVLDDYSSPIIVLLLGANILTLTWTLWGLDKRIALRVLSIVGTSIRQQLLMWFLISTLLSTILPNTVVAVTLCPIALSMVEYCSQIDENISKTKIKSWLLLAIVWGAGLGGFGTPMGGAMNLVAISHIENLLGSEYMYITWSVNMLPYLLALTGIMLVYFMFIKIKIKNLSGSRKYFQESYKKLGRMSKAEMIAISLFISAILLAFGRPLYENILPSFKAPFAFILLGVIAFFIKVDKNTSLITWKYAV